MAEQLAANTLAQSAVMHTFNFAGAALRDLMSNLIARDGDAAEQLRASGASATAGREWVAADAWLDRVKAAGRH